MTRNEWLLADKNIQHRMLNAILKEQICPEDAKINKTTEKIELQYHGRVLTAYVLRKSMLERYVFDGAFTYQCGDERIQITSLESLLNILNDAFDIEISERLYHELIHSRDSFVESYKQFNNRTSLIHQSMTFSMLPDTINFFTWLQHIKDNGATNDLSYSESLVLEGHPTHPLTKMKLPLTTEEIRRYAPEFEKIIPLHIMLVSSSHIITTSMENDEQYIVNQVIPELKDKLQAFLKPLDLDINDYRAIFVHPWQYDHVIGERFKTWISDKILIPTPFTVESKATLSFRTMELLHHPFHIKLPVNVQATSAVRTISTVTTVDGPKLSYALQDMLNIYPELKVAAEPFGEYVDVDPDLARQLACIVREKPVLTQEGSTIVSASLVNRNPVDNDVVVDSYIKWTYNELTSESIERFIRQYTSTLVRPLIAYIQDYGIALEAHMQNTIVNLGPNYQMNFLVRDLGGSRIDLQTLKYKLPDVEITNESLIADSIEAVIGKFQHAVVQNQLAELIHHFNQYDMVNEQALFKIVQQEIETAIDDNKNHAEALHRVLFGQKISVKALLSMRMENKVKKYLNTELENPIKKRCKYMANININLSKIQYNAKVLQTILDAKHIQFTPVIKSIAGDRQIVQKLIDLGITHFADSRLENIRQLTDFDCSFTILRSTQLSQLDNMIKNAQISIQTELNTILELNRIAEQLNLKHQVILMVDWKDGREGVLTYDVVKYIETILNLSHIQLIGLSFNFMCFKSGTPIEDDVFMINKFVSAIEREIGYRMKIVSGGNSSMIPLTMYNDLGKINELRIGETLFRGVDTTTDKPVSHLYQDAIVLEAEILEIKPRMNSHTKQSYLQAIVDIGYIDTDTTHINPIANDIQIIGASSDHLMIDLNNQDHYQIGNKIQFQLSYEALSRSMYNKNLEKVYATDMKVETMIHSFNEPFCSIHNIKSNI